MKIIEIISMERVEPINEGIASSIGKLLKPSGFENAVKDLVRFVDTQTGKLVTTDPYVQQLITRYGGKVVKATEKEAGKIAKSADAALFYQKLNSVKLSLTQYGTWIKNTGWVYIIGKPFYDYNDEINQGIEQVESGNWDDNKFQLYRKQRLAVLVTKASEQILYYFGIGAASKVVATAGKIGGNLITLGKLSKIPGIGALSIMTTLGTTAAQMHFMNSLNTKEGADAIATLVISPILGTKFTISDTVGLGATKALDYIKKKIDEALNSSGIETSTAAKPAAVTSTDSTAMQQEPVPNDNTSYVPSSQL